ncbi:hypothetical protein ONS95_001740 [Cadophora gregata]|uniref:uncharacterized protein n=1 Tax=Cadophora gregata TaxID=51156 RepID=UPI0026DD100D|nr:uncharacterized protein ONS95_001740 [Cadophora gregata]KAK0111379.1 hypothetical protein ONS95_001740 [Cadophora gregata]
MFLAVDDETSIKHCRRGPCGTLERYFLCLSDLTELVVSTFSDDGLGFLALEEEEDKTRGRLSHDLPRVAPNEGSRQRWDGIRRTACSSGTSKVPSTGNRYDVIDVTILYLIGKVIRYGMVRDIEGPSHEDVKSPKQGAVHSIHNSDSGRDLPLPVLFSSLLALWQIMSRPCHRSKTRDEEALALISNKWVGCPGYQKVQA